MDIEIINVIKKINEITVELINEILKLNNIQYNFIGKNNFDNADNFDNSDNSDNSDNVNNVKDKNDKKILIKDIHYKNEDCYQLLYNQLDKTEKEYLNINYFEKIKNNINNLNNLRNMEISGTFDEENNSIVESINKKNINERLYKYLNGDKYKYKYKNVKENDIITDIKILINDTGLKTLYFEYKYEKLIIFDYFPIEDFYNITNSTTFYNIDINYDLIINDIYFYKKFYEFITSDEKFFIIEINGRLSFELSIYKNNLYYIMFFIMYDGYINNIKFYIPISIIEKLQNDK